MTMAATMSGGQKMFAMRLAIVLMALAMAAAMAVAPASAQGVGQGDELDFTMRGFVKNDMSQVMVVGEVDALTSRNAAAGYDYFTEDTVSEDMNVLVVQSEELTRSLARQNGVTQMTVYAVVDLDTFQPGLVIVAQDGRYVYLFYLLAVEDGAELDTDALYDVFMDTGEWLLESISVPRGWIEIDLDDRDVPIGIGI